MNSDEINKILKNKNCNGCSNRCSLANPGCNRSKIFIEEAIEKINRKNKKDENNWVNIKLF